MKFRFRLLIFAAILGLVFGGCATNEAPATSPQGQAYQKATRVVQSLDVLRDAAVSLNDVRPDLLSTDNTRLIVQFHKSAVKTIAAVPEGWKAIIAVELDNLKTHIPDKEYLRIAPYVALTKALIEEVGK